MRFILPFLFLLGFLTSNAQGTDFKKQYDDLSTLYKVWLKSQDAQDLEAAFRQMELTKVATFKSDADKVQSLISAEDMQRLNAYHSEPISLTTFQNALADDFTAIEFLVSDRYLYTLVVDRSNAFMTRTPLEKRLLEHVLPFMVSLKDIQYEVFIQESPWLYQNVIAPIRERIKTSNLLIIPDGELNYVSFELLLQSAAKEGDNFGTLDYMLNDFNILYSYSATLYDESKRLSLERVPQKGFIGLAPEFTGEAYNENRVRLIGNDTSTAFVPLPDAQKEVLNLADLFKGESFVKTAAQEKLFKSKASEYGIIHVATHTAVNNQNPLFSKLILLADDKEDGLLNTYELFSMKLNADLVTLSACNSGLGSIDNGRGVMNLSRGFSYAGAANVVMSLWPVPDKSTSEIMTMFYNNLIEGMPKHKALRKAKLDYIRKSPTFNKSPIFWGGFVVLGNEVKLNQAQLKVAEFTHTEAPKSTKKRWGFIYGIAAIVGIGLLGFIGYKMTQ